MEGALRIGQVAGIPIGVHYTWLIAFLLLSSSLAIGFFPATYPGWDVALYWTAGALATILLFASVLAHELAHSLVARARGLRVADITLFIFGGISRIHASDEDPQDEFFVAVVGPLSSLALAGLAWVLLQAVGGLHEVAHALLFYLAIANALLAGFNLIPGFPLDGGRVFRALLWKMTGDLQRATNIAATTGQIVAFGFIALGILQLFAGNIVGGLWIAFIGWFLNGGAEASRQEVIMRNVFRNVRVADLMTPEPPVVPASMPVDEFVLDWVIRRGWRAVPVVDNGRVIGIVSISDVKDRPTEEWNRLLVGDIMTRSPLSVVGPLSDASAGLDLMAERGHNQVLVIDPDGRLVGMLTRAGVIQYLQLNNLFSRQFRPAGKAQSQRPSGSRSF